MMQFSLGLAPQVVPAREMSGAWRAGAAAVAAGREKAARVAPDFVARASDHIVLYLSAHGTSSGELLSDSCKLAGIRPTDDRHFGAVFQGLLRRGVIVWAGSCRRNKGHASRGGSLYDLRAAA